MHLDVYTTTRIDALTFSLLGLREHVQNALDAVFLYVPLFGSEYALT